MKKLLILSSLALLVAPSFSSNISTDIAGGAIKYFADDTTSSSEETTTYTITYHYNMTSWKDTGNEKLYDTETETVMKGSTCAHQYDHFKLDDENSTIHFYYGTYTFKGWFTDQQCTQSFKFSSEITENHDLWAKWEFEDTEYVATLRKCETKAQLYYAYSKTTNEAGSTIYDISNIGIRFGGMADYTSMYYLVAVSGIKKYGIDYSTISPSDKGYNGSFKEALDRGDIYSKGEVSSKERTSSDKIEGYDSFLPPKYTVKDSDGKAAYYSLFSVYFDVKKESIKTTIYAAARITLNNNTEFYFESKETSVSSLATEYLDKQTELGITDQDQLATLALLKEGKTSSTDTNASEN